MYTHYYTYTTDNITKKTWDSFCDTVREIIARTNGKKLNELGLGLEEDDTISLVNGVKEKNTKPTLNGQVVCFNGEGWFGHESFYITCAPSNDDRHMSFIKTARKPYDVVVVACLCAAEYFNIIRRWSSDGDYEEIEPGKILFKNVIPDIRALNPRVVIQVSGGVAHIHYSSPGVDVTIIDCDDLMVAGVDPVKKLNYWTSWAKRDEK